MVEKFQILDVDALAAEIVETLKMPVSQTVGLSQGEAGPVLTALMLLARNARKSEKLEE